MKFLQVLQGLKARNDSRGDFVRVAINAVNLPDAVSWSQVAQFMHERGEPSTVIWAGEQLWRDYQKASTKADREDRRASHR
jgi:hypothetical protein